jgi:hypothetical protein
MMLRDPVLDLVEADMTFRKFLERQPHPSLFLPLADGRDTLVDDIDNAAAGGVWGCSLARGRGATTLAIACAAWLQIEGVATYPLYVTSSQAAADDVADSLRRDWLAGEESLTECRGVMTSAKGRLRRSPDVEILNQGAWQLFRPGARIRTDFLIIDTPHDSSSLASVTESHQRQRAIGEWLQAFGPGRSPRAILINC